MDERMHMISVTGIVIKDGKYLITRRSLEKKAFPGKWTIPGGKLELVDYQDLPKDTSDHWYNVLEKVIRREIKEEVGLEIKNIRYLTSLSFLKSGETPVLIVSMFADYGSGDVKTDEDTIDHRWVNLDEARGFDLIEGIYEELEMLDKRLKGEEIEEWAKNLEEKDG